MDAICNIYLFFNNLRTGRFLSRLGLKEYVPLEKLLELISTRDNGKRMPHLNYFIKNFYIYYKNQYSSSSVSVAFLPCVDTEELALPYDCYSDPSCKIMGYKILRTDLIKHAEILGVEAFPTARDIYLKLIEKPENILSIENASEVFSFAAKLQRGK